MNSLGSSDDGDSWSLKDLMINRFSDKESEPKLEGTNEDDHLYLSDDPSPDIEPHDPLDLLPEDSRMPSLSD